MSAAYAQPAEQVILPNKRLQAKSEHGEEPGQPTKLFPNVCGRGLTWHGCWGCSSPEIGIYVLAIQVGRIHLDSVGGASPELYKTAMQEVRRTLQDSLPGGNHVLASCTWAKECPKQSGHMVEVAIVTTNSTCQKLQPAWQGRPLCGGLITATWTFLKNTSSAQHVMQMAEMGKLELQQARRKTVAVELPSRWFDGQVPRQVNNIGAEFCWHQFALLFGQVATIELVRPNASVLVQLLVSYKEPEGAAAFMEALTDRYLLYTKSGVPDDCYPVTLTPGDGYSLREYYCSASVPSHPPREEVRHEPPVMGKQATPFQEVRHDPPAMGKQATPFQEVRHDPPAMGKQATPFQEVRHDPPAMGKQAIPFQESERAGAAESGFRVVSAAAPAAEAYILRRCGKVPVPDALREPPETFSISTQKPRLVFGREDTCDAVLRHQYVSKVHGTFVLQDSPEVSMGRMLLLLDSSSNGVWVNGVRMATGRFQQLHPGDRISFLAPITKLDEDPATWEVCILSAAPVTGGQAGSPAAAEVQIAPAQTAARSHQAAPSREAVQLAQVVESGPQPQPQPAQAAQPGPGRAVPEVHKAQPAQVNGQSSQPENSAQRAQAQPAQRAKRPQPEQRQQAPPVQKSPSNQQTQQHKPQQEKQQPQNTKQPPQQRALQEALPPGEQPETDTTAARPKQKRAKTAAKASALRVAEEGSKREASPAKTPRPSKIRAAKTMPRPSDAKQGPDNEGTAEAMAGYASGYAALAAACLEAAQEEEEEEAEAQRRAELPAIKPIASKEEASPSQSVQAASVAGNLSQLLLSADGPQQCLGGALPLTAISPPTSALPVTSPAPTPAPLPPPPPPPPPPVNAELGQEPAPAWPPQPLVMPMAVATAKTAPAFQKSEVAPITPSRLGLAAPVTPPKATAPERAPWRSGPLLLPPPPTRSPSLRQELYTSLVNTDTKLGAEVMNLRPKSCAASSQAPPARGVEDLNDIASWVAWWGLGKYQARLIDNYDDVDQICSLHENSLQTFFADNQVDNKEDQLLFENAISAWSSKLH